jgi:4-hydroxyacetophenone monooxygenase
MHSAQWRPDLSLAGKRVVCIGTGASALQFLPHVAAVAADLVVTQRTAPWLAPTPDYHDAVPDGLQWLYGHVPSYSEFNRFSIFWRMGDGALESVRLTDVGERRQFGQHGQRVRSPDVGGVLQGRVRRPAGPAREGGAHYPVGAKRMVRQPCGHAR